MNELHPYIEKRIAELGFTDYHIQPTILQTNTIDTIYAMDAFNELFFLIGSAPTGTRILSDTEAVQINQQINDSPIQPYFEFSGQIEVILPFPQATSLEFLRVIPK